MCCVLCLCVCMFSYTTHNKYNTPLFSCVIVLFSLIYILSNPFVYIDMCVFFQPHFGVCVLCVCVYNVSFFCSFSPSFRLFSVINVLLWLRYYFKARLSLFSLCVYFLPFPFFLLPPSPFSLVLLFPLLLYHDCRESRPREREKKRRTRKSNL